MSYPHPQSYFTLRVQLKIARARSFETLAGIALSVLIAMPRDVSMVCGPITSGGIITSDGTSSVEKNTARLSFAIDLLALRGENVFTQLLFSDAISRIMKNAAYYKGPNHLLDTLYFPIFYSGFITRLCFLRGWQSSYGAQWEHDRAGELGIERAYFVDNFESVQVNEPIFKP